MTKPDSRDTERWQAWLARAPDPERAAPLADGVIAALTPDAWTRLEAHDEDRVGSLLLASCGIAPFFATRLRRDPERVLALLEEDLTNPLTREALAERLKRAESQDDAEPEAVLRRFKYHELARITWRDVCEDLVPLERSAETLTEMSQLADLLLERSLETALARVGDRFGPPEWPTESGENARLDFCVIALGKLGGGELNFSSDVDLIYVHEAPPPGLLAHPERPAPRDYFARVAQAFGKIASAHTDEGFLYRVDLDLRPSGAQGELVINDEALEAYYEQWADTWEKATFTKARPVAGALEFGWQTIRSIGPLIYLSTRDYAAVHSIRELKDKFEQAHGSDAAGNGDFDVKLDAGGIREVEFVAQAMQLLHGARIPQLRTRSTLDTLDQLAQVRLLEPEHAASLREDYLRLRRLENRLQMEGERQVHRLPREAGARTRLARALGVTDDVFEADLAALRERVHLAYESVLAGSGADGGAEPVLDVFLRPNPQWAAFPASRQMLEELAGHFARAIDASGERERALNNLVRFAEGVGGRRSIYELLLDRPELVERLTALFATSKFLSGYVASHPRLIEPLFDDAEILLLPREDLEKQLDALTAAPDGDARDPVEHHLDGLRLFHHAQTVNVGLLDLADMIEPADAQGALSDIAEVCVEDALAFTARQLASRHPGGQPRFIVVAMGKLATRELTYGSDLDLIFLFDATTRDGSVDLAAQEYFVKLTQRFISTLQTPTTEGACYEIDARLRPSGNQGTLVTSLDSFRRYHASSAETWERQALLRARPVAGDDSLATAFGALRHEILSRPLPDGTAAEIGRIRARMEAELARETSVRRNFKTGRGGVLDVETIVQALQLLHGAENPELFQVASTEVQLDRLEQLGWIPPTSADALRQGWRFLQRLASRLRIVDNRSISDLDRERGDLEGLARRLGYTSPGREGGARRALLIDYEAHTDAIRAEFSRLFQNV